MSGYLSDGAVKKYAVFAQYSTKRPRVQHYNNNWAASGDGENGSGYEGIHSARAFCEHVSMRRVTRLWPDAQTTTTKTLNALG